MPDGSTIYPEAILRLRQVVEMTGLSRPTIYRYISAGRFPPPRQLGERAVGWLQSEVVDYLRSIPAVQRPATDRRAP